MTFGFEDAKVKINQAIGIAMLAATVQMSLCTSAYADLRADWNIPQKPFQVYGNTYYVGTHGLSSILITSPTGHALIDGTLPEAVPQIVANIQSLGFRIEDVKLILNSHVHFDHAGGIAELQQLSGAKVVASSASAPVLLSGEVSKDDPQFGGLPKIAAVANVSTVKENETLKVGALALTAHFTPGHTPGGTSWSWQSCEQKRCVSVVYADSLNPISAENYRYTDTARNPNGVQQLEKSYSVLTALPCDVLLVPHPELADLFGKLELRKGDSATHPFVDAI
jgi:metallo-beta-lactamase class B